MSGTPAGPVPLHHTADGPSGAPVLVLGGGLGTTVQMWQPQLVALAERFRVIRYDHRGHGRSPALPGRYALADLGRDVLALLDTLGVRRAHLGGLSLGGMVAMWLAATAPERVDRLALLCTSARLGPPQLWARRAEAVRAGGMPAVADAVLARWFTPRFVAARPDVVEGARHQLLTTTPEGYAGCCAAIETMDLVPALPAIRASTLVIAGADDEATPPEHAEAIAAGIAAGNGDARTSVLADAAHLANVEQPAEVTRLLLEFLPRGEP